MKEKDELRTLNIIDKYSDQFIMIMSSMKRYNNRIRIKDESLAEHSFYVAYNVMNIGIDLEIDEQIIHKAVAMAIIHDVPESYTSDLPHDCKQNYPELREILNTVEMEFMKKKMPKFLKYYEEHESAEKTICSRLVELGDAVSVLQYCTREIELGNQTDDFKVILHEIHFRIFKLYNELVEVLKQNKKENVNAK